MSTENTNERIREEEGEPVVHEKEATDSFQEQFESLEIPENIDPRLLDLWMRREREVIESRQKIVPKKRVQARQGRPLNILFAAFIGITVMCLTIMLGLVQGKESDEILPQACQVFLLYTIIGFLVGCIVEYSVTDSVETLLREIVRRGEQPQQTEPASTENKSVSES